MNISFTINLSFDERRAFGKQCEKEFKHAVCVFKSCDEEAHKAIRVPEYKMQFVPGCGLVNFRKDPSTLARERDEAFKEGSKHLISLISNSNVSKLRAIAIVDIVEAFNLPIDHTMFNEMVAYRGCSSEPKEDKPYYRKLALYIMYRAGIITKQTRDKLLSVYKEKSAITQRASEQAKLNKIHKCYLKFMNDLGEIITPKEKQELWEASGVHAYLVKKYGIEKVCNCCVGYVR
jgi:hypothetical protein